MNFLVSSRTPWKISTSRSVFRKIAMGTWWSAGDPSVYGLLEIDMTATLRHLDKQKYPIKVTPGHLVGRAITAVLKLRPEINGLIIRNRIYQRENVDLFYQVNIPGPANDPVGKANLSGCTVRNANDMTVVQIAQELDQKSKLIKTGGKGELSSSINTLSIVPWGLIRWVLSFTSFLNFDLNLPLKYFGMPKDPFGSVMITNIGSMGVDIAWAPLVPYSRVPLLLAVGAIKEEARVVDGNIQIRPIMKIGVTFDHRFMDGVHAAQMSQLFKECFAHPEKFF